VNIGLDLPTGDGKLQVFQKELPVNLVDPRYFGASVTFGFNILGGIQLPNGDSSFEFGVGYMDPNAWNPTFDLPEGTYPITQSWDTFLVKAAWNQDLGNGREQKITLWGLYHDVIYSGNMPQFQLGPSLEASYQRQDPTGFSMKAGINIPTTNSYLYSGSTLSPEPYNGRGIRLYFDPTLGLGEVDLAVQTTLVLPNDYPQNSAGHISGGWVLGMMPTWKRPLDDTSSLVLRAGYSKVIAKDAALDSSFTLVDVLYDIFRFGAEYEFCF
jgi:hypothetical protein